MAMNGGAAGEIRSDWTLEEVRSLAESLHARVSALAAQRPRGWIVDLRLKFNLQSANYDSFTVVIVLNIGSRASLGKETRLVYGATKAAVASMTRTAAIELVQDGITVNCVAPGPIETDMIRRGYPPGSEERRRFTAGVPMGRFGSPREIAAAVGYFLSDESGFTTGQVLYVCGGLSVGLAPI